MNSIEQMRESSFNDVVVKIVAAYVSNNAIRPSDVPGLIESVHRSLKQLAVGRGDQSPLMGAVHKPTKAQISKSVQTTGLVSFVDGKVYQTLKRHLSSHGLGPASHRKRYGLPDDYPMVSPSYSARRSNLAKAVGLASVGRRLDTMSGKDKAIA